MKKLLVAAAAAMSAAAVAAVPGVALAGGRASVSSAAAQFAADRATLNAASVTFGQAFEAWEKSGGSSAETSSFVDTFVSAIVAQDHKLLGQSWPAADISDIDTLVRGDAAVEGVVSSLVDISSSSYGYWFIVYNEDAAVGVADANIVRRDLGLPLASSS
jgi:hypothetical protein